VRWEADGQKRKAKANLQGIPQQLGDRGTLYLIINPDNSVQAKGVRFGDMNDLVGLVKGVYPEGEYTLGFVNKTGHALESLCVYYGDQRAGCSGDVRGRAKAAYSERLALPFPSEAEVRWTEDAAPQKVKVKLEGVVPKGFAEGTIFFVIRNGGNVQVRAIKWADGQASIDLVREPP
jgi:hypothetical protein